MYTLCFPVMSPFPGCQSPGCFLHFQALPDPVVKPSFDTAFEGGEQHWKISIKKSKISRISIKKNQKIHDIHQTNIPKFPGHPSNKNPKLSGCFTPESEHDIGTSKIHLLSIGDTSSLVDFPGSHLSFPGFFTIDFVASPSSGGLGSLCDSRRQLSALASWL